eukprot:g7573.t1
MPDLSSILPRPSFHQRILSTSSEDMNKGLMMNTHLSPLACVWASLQVLIGDVSSGLRSVLYWYSLWKKHDALPEVYDTRSQSPTQARDSPLRPELIEAIFYLSLALPGDAAVFEMARSMADAIDEQSRVSCGFAAVADVTTKRLDNRMDSFFLSETLVYLYLAMAPSDELASALPWPLGSSVFTTEGHIFPLHGPGHEGNTGLEASLAAWDRTLPLLGAEAPIATCEALSPFERVAVQQRCRTKYLLTPSYQLQMVAETTRRCRPQEVSLLVWTEGLPPLRLHALASSLGRAVAALPLLHHRLLEDGKAAPRPDLGAGAGRLDSPERKKTPPSAWPQSLSLLRLDLEQSPGRMPSFSSALRLEPLRRLFATRFLQAPRFKAVRFLFFPTALEMSQGQTPKKAACPFLQPELEPEEIAKQGDLEPCHLTQRPEDAQEPCAPRQLVRPMEPMKIATPETLSPQSTSSLPAFSYMSPLPSPASLPGMSCVP